MKLQALLAAIQPTNSVFGRCVINGAGREAVTAS